MKHLYFVLILLQTIGIGSLYSQEKNSILTESSQTLKERTYQHLIMYGQSLSTGAQSYPALSTENIEGNYMIGDQVWIEQGNTHFTDFNPLKASTAIMYQNYPKNRASITLAETPLVGLVNHLQLKQPKAGIKYLASSDGENGKSIEALSKKGALQKNYYNDYFLKSVESAANIARSNGYKMVTPAIFWLQGEYNYFTLHDDNTSGATLDKYGYKKLLVELKNDMQKDIMNAYGQTKKPVFITYQVGSLRNDDNLNIGLAQLELSNTYDDIINAGPIYHLPHRGIHMDANGYRWYGEMLAKVYYKTQVLGEDFKPLQPKQIYRISSNSVGIIFHVPQPPMVFDTNLVQALPNYGFKIKNNGVEQKISEVKIDSNNNTIIISCTNAITGNVEVIYGQQNIYLNNKLLIKAGNLRDSDNYPAFFTYVDLDAKKDGEYIYPREKSETTLRPDNEPKDKDGSLLHDKPYPLYNFSVAFSYTLDANRTSVFMPGFRSKQDILYVKKGSNGDGSSWENALGELADALKIAEEQNMGNKIQVNQIWVAKGSYSPLYTAGDGGNANDRSFVLPKNVEIYGGFTGTETSVSQRDWINNSTTLQGDNVYHVVISSGDAGKTVLDGFTIKGGNASLATNACNKKPFYTLCHIMLNNSWIFTGYGGGVYLSNSSPKLKNLIIEENKAVNAGAGLIIDVSNPLLSNVTIKDNILKGSEVIGGGGVYNYKSSPNLVNVTINNNKIEATNSTVGAGIYNHESIQPKLTNVLIADNSITIYSKYKNVIGRGGGIFNKNSGLLLTNSLIVRNKSHVGGGIYMEGKDGSKFTNVTVSDNEVLANRGSGLYCNSADPIIYNSIIWGNKPNTTFNDEGQKPIFNYSLVQYNFSTDNFNLSGQTDPLFEDGYKLNPNSPVINKGNNEYITATNKDLDNNPRIVNKTVDIGAYEYQNETSCNSFNDITINDTEVTYDGTPKEIVLNDLPDHISAEIKYKGIGNTSYNESSDAPIDAGTYLIIVQLKNNSESTDCETTLTANLTINKAITEIVSDDLYTYVYDGKEKKVFASHNHTDSSITYEPQQEYVNAGGYTITAKSAETKNYLAAKKDIILVIEKANFTNISLPEMIVTYDGLEKSMEVTGTVPAETDIVYEYEGIKATSYPKQKNKPVNSGTYLVTATVSNPNYNTLLIQGKLLINKANFNGIKLNEKVTTYNGDKHNNVITVSDKLPNNTEIKYEYEGVNHTSYPKNTEEPINSGTYLVTATITNSNYNTLILSNYLIINKAEAIITAEDEQSFIYDGNEKNISATLNHSESQLQYLPKNKYINAGDYEINIEAPESDNYQKASKKVILKIKRAKTVITAQSIQIYTYDGKKKTVTGSINHKETTIDSHPQKGYINAGEYSITLRTKQTKNYEAASLDVKLIIEKAQSIISADDIQTFFYNGKQRNISATLNHNEADLTFSPQKGFTESGSYDIVINAPASTNYESVSKKVKLIIKKAEALITANEIQTYTFDGTVKNVVAQLNHDEAILTYSPQRGYTDVGSYKIIVSAPSTSNYEAVTKSITLNINKSVSYPSTIKLESKTFTYDGNPHSLLVEGYPEGTQINYENNDKIKSGTYTVTATLIHKNYKDVQLFAQLIINKASSIISAKDLQNFTYDGKEKVVTASLNHNETSLSYFPQQGYSQAGKYTITAKAAESNNYKHSSKQIVLNIEKANAEISADEVQTFTYDGNLKKISATLNHNETELTYSPVNGFTNAGEYTITISAKATDNYKSISKTVILRIEKAEASIIADDTQIFSYDGSVKNVKAILNHKEAHITYSPKQGYTEVGSYVITANAPETSNYKKVSKEITLKINYPNKFPASVKLENKSFTYNGEPHSLVISGLPESTQITYVNNEHIKAGSYLVTAILTHPNYGKAEYTATLTIDKAKAIISADDVQSFIYDGLVKNVTATLNHTETDLIYSQGYINAGEYTITVSAPESDNYKEVSKIITLKIEKATTIISAEEIQIVTYDGTVKKVNAYLNHNETAINFVPNEGGYINAGTYKITIEAPATQNYKAASKTVTLKINKADAEIIAPEFQTYDYDGTVKKVTARLNHDEAVISYEPQQGYTDIGIYIITASAPETTNYNKVSKDIKLKIVATNSFPASVLLESKSFIYDGKPHSLSVTGIPESTQVSYENNGHTNAGSYLVKAKLNHPNYGSAEYTATLTIDKAPSIISGSDTQTLTYDGSVKNVTATLNHTESNLIYSPQEIRNAGEYVITVFAPGSKNYKEASKQITLIIKKAVANISADETQKFTYDGSAKYVTATLNHTETNLIYTPQSFINAGIHKVTVSAPETQNYLEVSKQISLIIVKAKSVISADDIQTFIYDGSVKNVQANLNHKETNLIYSPQQGYIEEGSYDITITANESSNYLSSSKNVKLVINKNSLGVDDITVEDEEIKIAPNPVSTTLKIVFSKPLTKKEAISMYDLMGRLIMETTIAPGEKIKEVDFNGYYSGVYILKYKNKVFKIVKE